MGGIMIFILVNHNPDAYDEYFDGKKYKDWSSCKQPLLLYRWF
jgi:hypothetical protein